MYHHIISKSGENKYDVYVNLIASPAGSYINRFPYIINLAKELLAATKLKGDYVAFDKDMGRIIGTTNIIDTTDKDSVYYAQSHKRKIYMPYAKNRQPVESNKLSVILKRDENGNYELSDIWIGPCSPPFPGEDKEASNSKDYWQSHALIQDTKFIKTNTITKTCPY